MLCAKPIRAAVPWQGSSLTQEDKHAAKLASGQFDRCFDLRDHKQATVEGVACDRSVSPHVTAFRIGVSNTTANTSMMHFDVARRFKWFPSAKGGLGHFADSSNISWNQPTIFRPSQISTV